MDLRTKLPIVALGVALCASASQAFASEVALKGAELGKWTMDYDAALKLAAEKKLPLLLNFTGSDWCGWCQLMDESVYAKPAWKEYASKNIVTVTIDFPRDRKGMPKEYTERNAKLAEQFGVQGYPTYVILEQDGKTELGRLGAGEDKTPESFIQELSDVLRYSTASIEAKVAALGSEKGAQYRAAIESVRGAEKELTEWLQTGPEKNADNIAKFKAFSGKIEAEKAKAAAF